ncbi:MAG: PepSY-associated TM helix domain-containing protein [Acidobacteriota bacterium]
MSQQVTKKPVKRLGPFKIRQSTVQRFYDIHSWLGVIGGLVFFVCIFSGTLALFEQELTAWEHPETRFEDGTTKPIDELLAIARTELDDPHDMFVWLPTPYTGGLEARSFTDGTLDRVHIDPVSGEVVERPGRGALQFLTLLHTDLHLPRPFGRYLVGLLGVFMMMSLISGVMAHPKAIRDLFLLRWRPKLRLTYSDLHKQVGVWGLIFGMVMAATGAVIGLLGLFAPIMVLSAFGGDVGKATEAFSGPHREETGIEAPMLPVSPLIDDLEARHPGSKVGSLFFHHWGDETAEVTLNLERDPYREMATGEGHRVSLVDGETVFVSTFTSRGVGTRLFGTVQPLHYGLFGGLGLKMIYFVSGLLLALGIVTGTLIWLERRRPAAVNGVIPRDRYFWLGRLHLGVSLGLVLASALALAAGRFAPGTVEPVFWSIWLLVLAGSFVVPNAFMATRVGGFTVAVILCAIAIGDLFGSALQTPATTQVSYVLLAIGLLTAALSSLSPKHRVGTRPTLKPARVEA